MTIKAVKAIILVNKNYLLQLRDISDISDLTSLSLINLLFILISTSLVVSLVVSLNGYSLILIGGAFIRELFGAGTLFGVPIFGDWYPTNNLLLLPPSSFIIIGLFIWLIRGYNNDQIEEDEFDLSKHSVSPNLNKRELNVWTLSKYLH